MDARSLGSLSLPLLRALVLVAPVNERRGLQPVVTLTVNGAARANIRVGEAAAPRVQVRDIGRAREVVS
jgi:hypothetical protein